MTGIRGGLGAVERKLSLEIAEARLVAHARAPAQRQDVTDAIARVLGHLDMLRRRVRRAVAVRDRSRKAARRRFSAAMAALAEVRA